MNQENSSSTNFSHNNQMRDEVVSARVDGHGPYLHECLEAITSSPNDDLLVSLDHERGGDV